MEQKTRQAAVAVHEGVGKHKPETHQRSQYQRGNAGLLLVGKLQQPLHDGQQMFRRRRNVGHAHVAAQPVLLHPVLHRLVHGRQNGEVLQLHQIVFCQLHFFMGM
ncbi:hypothetical protein D3C71_1874580 [compost metagenome]